MKLTCVQSELKAALDIVKRQVPAKSTLACLTNLKLDANDGLTISGTDLESFVIKKIGAKVTEPGCILVPAALITEFVSSLPNDPVTLSLNKTKVAVECGKFKANINSLPVEDYPDIPTAETNFEFPSDILSKAINRVTYAAAKDDARPVLGGVYFQGGDTLRITTADGFRLAQIVVPINSDGFKALVPVKPVRDLARLLTGVVSIGINGSSIIFNCGSTVFGARLIDGQYPDTSRVIPKIEDTTVTVTVSVPELMRAVHTAGVFSKGGASSATINIGEQSLSVTCVDNEVGDGKSEINADVTGNPIEVKVNPIYLLEMLATMGDSATLYINNPSSPLLIKPVGDDSLIAVVMPIART